MTTERILTGRQRDHARDDEMNEQQHTTTGATNSKLFLHFGKAGIKRIGEFMKFFFAAAYFQINGQHIHIARQNIAPIIGEFHKIFKGSHQRQAMARFFKRAQVLLGIMLMIRETPRLFYRQA